MLSSLKKYLNDEGWGLNPLNPELDKPYRGQPSVTPVLWETDNVDQMRSLLVLREAEFVMVEAQLTGNQKADWWARNKIYSLKTMISDLKKRLHEADM